MVGVPLLEVRDLHVNLGGAHVLQGVSFDVPGGGITALLGRNGVGKTTTLRGVLGLVPRRGSVRFERRADRARGDAPHRRPRRRLRPRGPRRVRRPDRRREPAARRAQRRAALRARLRALPGAEGPGAAARRHALRRPAADGRDRTGAAQPEPAAPDRRADEGARAVARLRGCGACSSGLPRPRRRCSSSRTWPSCAGSPARSSCSTRAASSTPEPPPTSRTTRSSTACSEWHAAA